MDKIPVSDLHSKMDQLAMRNLELLEEIIQQRTNLENVMKSSFLSMAQARYSMGKNSVCSLQLPTEDSDVSARHVVLCDPAGNDELVSYRRYAVTKNVVESASVEEQPRQRMKEYQNSDKDKPRKIKNDAQKDPLLWFGVLVPSHLRDCQTGFKNTLAIVCAIATLQSELHSVCTEFRKLRKQVKQRG